MGGELAGDEGWAFSYDADLAFYHPICQWRAVPVCSADIDQKAAIPATQGLAVGGERGAAANADIYRARCLCHDRSTCWPIRNPGLHYAALGHAYRSVVFPAVAFTSATDGIVAGWCRGHCAVQPVHV
ncbi:hypothetical protein D3C80_1611830 [compost metagenome]